MSVADLTQDRLFNGFLKGFGGAVSPDQIARLLNRDVVIRIPRDRVHSRDLWPAAWALASVIERQFRGIIYLDIGLDAALPAPCALGPRCRLEPNGDPSLLTVCIGVHDSDVSAICGDARLNKIGLRTLEGTPPTAIECFAIAGYLGYHALAKALAIPPTRDWAAHSTLDIDYSPDDLTHRIQTADGYTSIGLGQVGQAFLALLWFLYGGDFANRRLSLFDPDKFEEKNQRTQILLAEEAEWVHLAKATYMAALARKWHAQPNEGKRGIDWTWKRRDLPEIGLVGPHNFEVRRMACNAGFAQIIECGVGTNLLSPRVSWHAVRGSTNHAKSLFMDRTTEQQPQVEESSWVSELKKTPGECGWVQFLGVTATAPCLGITAAAFALAELACQRQVVKGSAILWSPFLPRHRETIAA